MWHLASSKSWIAFCEDPNSLFNLHAYGNLKNYSKESSLLCPCQSRSCVTCLVGQGTKQTPNLPGTIPESDNVKKWTSALT
uniref:Putative ovule protein n=1 Tax=Solanum chacoense TaxID=4108 RepID=A0A0V0H039_SOLCH